MGVSRGEGKWVPWWVKASGCVKAKAGGCVGGRRQVGAFLPHSLLHELLKTLLPDKFTAIVRASTTSHCAVTIKRCYIYLTMCVRPERDSPH